MSEVNPEQRLEQLQRELQEKKASLEKGYNEVARLTDQLQKDQTRVDTLQKEVKALQEQIGAQSSEAGEAPEPVQLTPEERENNRKHIDLIAQSDLFDAEWYLETYPDVAKSEKFSKEPAAHYTLFGGFEGRNPCPEFNSAFYIATNADVAKAKVNPLAHYLRFGRDEGRAFAPPVDGE